MTSADFSPVAVTFQALGTFLLAVMFARLGRNFAWRYARMWAAAWASMFLAIVAVRIYIAAEHRGWWLLYLLAQWVFLVLLHSGCRELLDRKSVEPRYVLYSSPLAIAIAVALTMFAREFNQLFTIEAAIVAFGAIAAFAALGGVQRRTFGWQAMRVALALMAILYISYVPLYAIESRGITLPFLAYSSLADLLASVVLGFSMILIASEAAHRELTDAVSALQAARDQLQIKVNTDPLTTALSRHALNAMPRGMTGVAIMADIDGLKQINDHEGHAAGDAAIRAAANALRTRIRPDDLLFRWGGDEFLVIVPNSSLPTIEARLASLHGGVKRTNSTPLHISWGASEFGEGRSLDDAIRDADAAMYEKRALVRGGRRKDATAAV
jgi:diguanylate cyclase (GGDEF)-like protein